MPIHHLMEYDELSFLHKPVEFQLVNDHSSIKEFYDKAAILINSALTSWQKLDAFKALYFPSLQYVKRRNQLPKADWVELDDEIRRLIKQEILFVPCRTANEYIYGSIPDTLLGVTLAAEDADIATIHGAFKLLTSNDPNIVEMAWKDLCSTVTARLRSGLRKSAILPPDLNIIHLFAYLSSKRFPGMNPNSTIFKRVRIASDHLGVTWNFNTDKSISLSRRSVTESDRSKIYKSLRENLRKASTSVLKSKKNQ